MKASLKQQKLGRDKCRDEKGNFKFILLLVKPYKLISFQEVWATCINSSSSPAAHKSASLPNVIPDRAKGKT